MLQDIKKIIGFKIAATDGELGDVDDFYFDDETWIIRYMVVNTGNWLSGRKVLLTTPALGHPDWDNKRFTVNLTKEQVQNSPDIDSEQSISRHYEMQLHDYYGWTYYWWPINVGTGVPVMGIIPPPAGPNLTDTGSPHALQYPETDLNAAEVPKGQTDVHLHSFNNVSGYIIHLIDGELGHLKDFIISDESWMVQYLIVDTGSWFSGKNVLIDPKWLYKIDWLEQLAYLDLTRDTVKNSPEYNSDEPIYRDYEHKLYDYYGRKKYWET